MEKDQYDQAATVFSPDGRVYQVEYAREAIKRGGLALALTFNEGIIFTIDKAIFSPLMEEDNIEKFFRITGRIGAAASGLIADARVLVDIVREKAQEEKLNYGEEQDIRTLVMWISKIYEVYTRYEGVRPFGAALIIGGRDESGFHLYETDPSGVFQERKATAIGRGSSAAIPILETEHRPDMTRKEALDLAFKVLKESFAERPQDIPKGEEFHILTDKGFEEVDFSSDVERIQSLVRMASEAKGGDEVDKGPKEPPTPPPAHELGEQPIAPPEGPPSEKQASAPSLSPNIAAFLETVPKINKDVKQRLLERFMDMPQLMKATIDDLMEVQGVGRATAERIIKALNALGKQ